MGDIDSANGSALTSAPSAPDLDAGEGPEPIAPVLRAAWLLRITAFVSAVATALGVIVLPGVRGLAGDFVVGLVSRASWSFAYLMSGLVITASVLACFELSRATRMSVGPRIVAIGAAGAVLAFAAPAMLRHLPTPVALAMSMAAVLATSAAAWEGMRQDRTRAVAFIMAAFGLAALLRLAAWQIATVAGDRASTSLYATGRWVATAAVVFEGLGQMVSAAWLGTRSRFMGQILSSMAVAAAFFITWGAARGAISTAPAWQAGLHTALSGAAGMPPPFALSALATFLVPAGMLLALVAAVQPRQVAAIVCGLALTLIGRGAFDVPLRALAATAAALWLMVALMDDRAMWKSLIEQRKRRLEEERRP